MDDASIEQLRALAIASIPTGSRQSSKPRDDDKEEGELSSGNEAPDVNQLDMSCSVCPEMPFDSSAGAIGANLQPKKAGRKRKSRPLRGPPPTSDAAANGSRFVSTQATQGKKPVDLVPAAQPIVTSTANNDSQSRMSLNGSTTLKPASTSLNFLATPTPPQNGENPFLIKFSDDSDSEEDFLSPTGDRVSAVAVLKPSDLNLEIDRMRRQIAAMERVKAKSTPATFKTANSGKALSGSPHMKDLGVQTPNPTHLDYLRQQIASKESELQQKRQRMGTLTFPAPAKGAPVQKQSKGVETATVKDTVAIVDHERLAGSKHLREDEVPELPSSKKAKTAVDSEPEELATIVAPAVAAQVPGSALTEAAFRRPANNLFMEIRDLETEEEALDKELELAQQLRHTFEIRERLARKAYREAQEALRRANMDCERLQQKREVLSFRLKAAELKQYSSKPSFEEQLLLLGEPFSSHGQVFPQPDAFLTSEPSLPVAIVSSPPRTRAVSPPKTRAASPPKARVTSPKTRAVSPPKTRAASPPQARAASPPKAKAASPKSRAASPPKAAAASPPKTRAASPKARVASPPKRRAVSPPKTRVAFPPQARAASPPKARAAPPPQARAASPPKARAASSPKARAASPPERTSPSPPNTKVVASPPRTRASSPSKTRSPSPLKTGTASPEIRAPSSVPLLKARALEVTSEGDHEADFLNAQRSSELSVRENHHHIDQTSFRTPAAGSTGKCTLKSHSLAGAAVLSAIVMDEPSIEDPPGAPAGGRYGTSNFGKQNVSELACGPDTLSVDRLPLYADLGSPELDDRTYQPIIVASPVRNKGASALKHGALTGEFQLSFEGLLVVFRQLPFTPGKAASEAAGKAPNVRRPFMWKDYESPLANFRSFRMSPHFTSAFGFSQDSSTWSHSIDPFKPICKYELRGKCNNDHCPMQHVKQYKSDSLHLEKDLERYRSLTAAHEDLPVLKAIQTVSSALRSSCALTTAQIPVYRIGAYLMKGWQQTRPSSGSENDLYGYMTSIFTQRPLLRDMPCILDEDETASRTCKHLDAANSDFDKELPSGDPTDVDACLDLTLNILQYDVNSKSSNCLKNALTVLSRSLEINRQSVPLWVLYLTLFYKQKQDGSYKQHDLFLDAVHYNNGSYELWCMLLNSRRNLTSQLDSYEQAINALCHANDQVRGNSGCILDLVLRMLYCMAVSESTQLITGWTDALVADEDNNLSETVLKNLLPSDACVLWVSCGYLLAYGTLPKDVVARLGCRQELPVNVEWTVSLSAGEEVRERVIKIMKCASVSSPSGKEVLALNLIKCLVAFEGMEQASIQGQQLLHLYPSSVEIYVLCAEIEKQCWNTEAGLQVFEKGIQNWPTEKPGVQVMWNQYAGHALQWTGEASAIAILEKCAASATELCHLPKNRSFNQEDLQQDQVRQTLRFLTKELSSSRDSTFALLNLALYEALQRNMVEAQSLLEKVLASDERLGHCWQEYAAFRFFSSVSVSRDDFSTVRWALAGVLDKCYSRHSQLSTKLSPLGRGFLKEIKRHRNRCFIENVLGAPPPDYSFLNFLLRMAFGPDLLPSRPDLKSVEELAGGLLEVCPGNTELALALCRSVKNSLGTPSSSRPSQVAASAWAASLLVSSLELSFPVASEACWLEARELLEQLGLERACAGFYRQAEAAYPFSMKLWRSRVAYCKQQCSVDDAGTLLAAKERGLAL